MKVTEVTVLQEKRRNGEINGQKNARRARGFDGRREATRARESVRENEHWANRFVLVFADRFPLAYRPAAQADPSNRASVAPLLLLIRSLRVRSVP